MSSLNPTGRMTAWLEQAWMERYLDRQLGDDEIAWFEAYLLDKPHLLDRWSTELAMRDGIDLLTRRGSGGAKPSPALPEPTTLPSSPPSAPHHRPMPRRRRQWHMPAMAASVAMAFGAGFLLSSTTRTGHDDPLIADPTRFVIDASRGTAPHDNIENAGSASEFVLIDALVPPDATFVAVRGPGMAERRLNVSKDGVATLLLRRSEIERIGALTLVIKAGDREFERPLQLKQP